MNFALMVPVLITGAWAEKLTFRAFLAFVTVWPFLCYYPIAHWIWGHGFLARIGVIDFAGGITIHTNAGMETTLSSTALDHAIANGSNGMANKL
jgi:ammonium transporter, Amt family